MNEWRLTRHGAEWALGVDGGLDGDDALSLRPPPLLTLGLHLEHVRVVGQQVLHHHRILPRVAHLDALALA